MAEAEHPEPDTSGVEEIETGEESLDAGTGSGLEVASRMLPTRILLLPVTDRPFFPAQTMPVVMDEGPWLETVHRVGQSPHHLVGLLMADTDDSTSADPEDFFETGSVARIHHPTRSQEKIQFIAEGVQRFHIKRWITREPPYEVEVSYPSDTPALDQADEIKAYAVAIINSLKELMPLNPLYNEELKFFLNRFSPNEPSPLSDFAAALTTADRESLQDILATVDLRQRMEKVLVLVKKEVEVAQLQAQIHQQVEERMSEQQRQFFLKEQLKEIQKELGIAKDDRTADIERFQSRLEGLTVPEEAQTRIDEEIQKMQVLESGSPEYSVTRNYLDWITSLPWGVHSEDQLDIPRARRILDRDHDGLEDVKRRIIEFLAVGATRGDIGGSILLLVGPPGVGKTSIGRSVAEAVGREFYRFSVGGMRDEAEIKGHRRTYVGAMPGKFIQAVKDVGTANPVIMLDEVDKIGMSFQGDPASALLEVLDPEQNSDFLDHYLDVRFDLSRSLFICTANQLDTIPSALLDRMEVIHLAGYITEEKVAIAKHHLWPRQVERAGLKRGQLPLTDAALRHVIDGYARESGVRNLEKQLGRLVRKAAVDLLEGHEAPIRLNQKQVEDYLGKPPFQREKPLAGIGVVTGLAWTAMGGTTLSVEATRVHTQQRGFKLTGQLGEVMQESASIAHSYISSHLDEYRGDPSFFDESFIHLHVPEGATPKDGPSAGVTMATALLSLARDQAPARPLAMTGELTLSGHVYPVGGIREKVIAAKRARVTEVILPEGNRRDFDELPDHVRKGITVHFAERYQDVFRVVFDERPKRRRSSG
ncbi:ATP dependent PIM1 peptidase. Serine peptidase. MEROPS family S16 [Thiohalospira halophila DSM 15071]|uniref:Lon protease n=1 Tax=Thiohalospira halophila DSM 15071 TaxID=1123397 RepID=A0A1I1NAM1_9GAMM|nr:endopeptidase La [Thiohalospira halophila]SFC94689.1 ATP dependent PIM1 peptidase. Serine peptidase. MEROPS family S16 [Thiohalospira halophila DSM 15071]